MTFLAKSISVSINKSPIEVYNYASDPINLPNWAAGLSGSIIKVGDDWIADSPMGKVKVKFVVENTFGVLDHNVTLPSGDTIYNPVRVFPNNNGSEVIFTLYKLDNMSEKQFLEDADLVERDLRQLKLTLEK